MGRSQHVNSAGEDEGPRALLRVLDGRRQWLESGGKAGEAADLRGYELAGADLSGVILRRAPTCVKLLDSCVSNSKIRNMIRRPYFQVM